MLYLHRYAFALIKPTLKEEWNLSKTELAGLDSAFLTCYSAFQIPGGILCDLAGAHLFLAGIIVFWSLALAMHAAAPNMNMMATARILFGIGQAGAYAAISRITRTWFPAPIRTWVQGWVGVFFGRMGGVSSNLLFASVLMGMLLLDWRTAAYIFAAAGGLLGVLFLLLFRNSPRHHPFANQAEADLIEGIGHDGEKPEANKSEAADKPARMKTRDMFRRMSVRSVCNLFALNGQTILSTIADNIYSAWIPLFLFEVHGLKFKEMGFYSALPLLGGAFGGACGGLLNDWLIRATGNRRWSRTGVGLAGKGIASVLLFVALLFYNSPYVFCGMLFLVKFFGDWSLTTSWGVVTDIGGRATATVFAFNNSIASLVAIAAPMIYGPVADHYGWSPVFIIGGIAYALCAASWLLINSTIPIIAETSPADT